MIQQLWSTPFLHVNVFDEEQDLIQNLTTMVLVDADASALDATSLTRASMAERLIANDPIVVAAHEFMSKWTKTFVMDAYGVDLSEVVLEPFYLAQPHLQNVTYHNHGSMITGILYLDVPGGDVIFYDPRTNANRGMGVLAKTPNMASIKLSPKAGDLVMFPSYVYHVGTPNMAQRSRLLMPFDVMQTSR